MKIPGLCRMLILPAFLAKADKQKYLVFIKLGFGFINVFG